MKSVLDFDKIQACQMINKRPKGNPLFTSVLQGNSVRR